MLVASAVSVRFALLVGAVLCAGCGPLMAVVPRGGAPAVTNVVAGVQLTAHGAEWDAEPRELPESAHAVFVEVQNASAYPVRVALQDFFLVDESGAAVRPVLPGSLVLAAGREAPGELVAFRGFRGGMRFRGIRPGRTRVRHHYHSRSGYRGAYRYGVRRWAIASHPFWGRGRAVRFSVSSGWSGGSSANDVFSLALAEGTLAPGGRIAGFLYFPHAPGLVEQSVDVGWDVVAAVPPPPAPVDIDSEYPPPPPGPPVWSGLGRLVLPLETVDLR